ncbi:MAG: MFS transporter [Hyphomonadaceae bacterium]|jgi:PAT family beta-lactamase induction signal transducer AmpG|nr:MFS transporter [Hyphomonadaceae bacterium]
MASDSTATAQRESAGKPKAGFKTFFERSALVMFGLGFAAGMPNLLIGQTLVQTWIRQGGANLSLIGLMSLVTIFYALKFLWSPVVDKVAIPVLDKALGRRRSWMLVCQLVIVAGIACLALIDPSKTFNEAGDPIDGFFIIAAIAAVICFAGATQDVAIDAWRIEVARDSEKLGVLTSNYQVGYRVAMFVSGALVLYVVGIFSGPPPTPDDPQPYSFLGWSVSFMMMAVFMGLAVIATLLAPREHVLTDTRWVPPSDIPDRGVIDLAEWAVRLAIMALAACVLGVGMSGKPEPLAWLVAHLYLPGSEPGMTATQAMGEALSARPWGTYQQLGYVVIGLLLVVAACWKIPGIRSRPAAYFKSALGDPLVDFFGRYQSVATSILLFICLYRMSDFVLNLASTMYIDAGFTTSEVATAQKVFGVIVGAVSAIITGWAITQLGMFRCLVLGAFMQPLSNLSFILIAMNGPDPVYLYLAILIDNFSGMFAGTTFIVYLSMLTKDGFTATQYALFTSLYALPGKLITALGGRIVEAFAKDAGNGGFVSQIMPWVADLPPVAFAKAGEKIGVTGPAYAAGYIMFFFYTTLMGVFGVALAFVVSRGKPRSILEADTKAQADAQAEAEARGA